MSNNPNSPYHLDCAKIEWQPGDIPTALDYDDIYFNPQQGLQETEYVFLHHNHLQQRWQHLARKEADKRTVFTIGETGFGTGLNFLATWRLWQQSAPKEGHLHFVSVEKHPLQAEDLQRSLRAWPALQTFSEQLIAQYPILVPGHHVLTFDQGRVTLHLLLGDALECLEQLRSSNRDELAIASKQRINAWFLDGFAPAKNPSLWNDELYTLIAQLSAAGTTLSTFTAVGAVRRGLAKQGFNMDIVKGFGKKRDMLKGVFEQHIPQATITRKGVKAPWYFNNHSVTGNHVAVIGGGLAGCNSAYAMARRGWKVTLIERQAELAQAASGNPQGMLYTKLSPQPGQLNHFTLSSYLYALRYYQQLVAMQILPAEQLDFCGVLQLAITDKDKKLYQQLQQGFANQNQLVQFVDARQASNLAGLNLDHPGWYFPQAGWLSPPALCQSLACHPNIDTHYNSEALALNYTDQQWHIRVSGTTLKQADAVIIANSRDAQQFTQTQTLPLKTIRGQITLLDSGTGSSSPLTSLKTVICHEGYITPAINNGHHHDAHDHKQHSLGATFDNNDCDTGLRAEDHQRNLHSLQQAIPSISDHINQLDPQTLAGRAALRCTSPDYLPIVGPVHKQQQFLLDYAALRSNAHREISRCGDYYPGLYINVAHGSRGLTSTPLCSELLAATINSEPAPLPRALSQALNPARFTIRDLIRNKAVP